MTTFQKPTMIRIQNSLSIDMVEIPNKNYAMGKYPVTIAEYMHFAREHEEHLPEWKEEKNAPSYYKSKNLTDNAPIIGVSWHNAVAFCQWLSEKTGKAYRLPTEEEWYFACNGGKDTGWHFGDTESELEKYAWYRENSDSTTHLVGEKLPNDFGLYDMHGNVWEWCEDWYEDWYDNKKERKVLRGGSWSGDAYYSRSAIRDRYFPGNRGFDVGFRLLRTLP